MGKQSKRNARRQADFVDYVQPKTEVVSSISQVSLGQAPHLSLDRLTANRNGYVTLLDSHLASLESILSSDSPAIVRITTHIDLIQQTYSQINEFSETIRQLLSPEAFTADLLAGSVRDNKALDALNQAKSFLKSHSASSKSSSAPTCSQSHHTHKLEPLKLPQFAGNILSYQNFIDSFTSCIHNRSDFSDTIKYQYLLNCLSGSALADLSGLKLDPSSYQIALDILNSNYGQKTKVIQSHLVG